MKNKLTIILVFILVVIIILFIRGERVNDLVSSDFSKVPAQTEELPNAIPNAPKTYNFDSSTDLEKELDSINPQVLDSDFDQ